MTDYISRKVAIDYIERNKHRLGITEANACNFKDILRMQPSVSVREDVQGEWEKELDDMGWVKHTCSVCGFVKRIDIHVSLGWNFCPNCGARMKVNLNEL